MIAEYVKQRELLRAQKTQVMTVPGQAAANDNQRIRFVNNR